VHRIAVGRTTIRKSGTVQGAYDNGSGTALVVQLCKDLAHVALNRTLTCLLFDGEEEGLLGSGAFVDNDVKGNTQQVYDLYLGFDMVGVNWPGYRRLETLWLDGRGVQPPAHRVPERHRAQGAGDPDGRRRGVPQNDRNSDEASFAAAHVPTFRFAGGRTAGAYPQYHKPGDTHGFRHPDRGRRGRSSRQASARCCESRGRRSWSSTRPTWRD